MRVAEFKKSARYDSNEFKADGNKPQCIICGKNVDPAKAKEIELVDYGATVLLDGTGEENETSIGAFDIGTDCYKRLMKESTER